MKKFDLNTKNLGIIKKIAFIGHMGSGKSLLGKMLAQRLNYKHIDTDKLIENSTKIKINDIFKNQGEVEFRKIEEKTILNIPNEEKLVISLGGGSILSKKIRNFLQINFLSIFLDVDLEILVKRLENSSRRPLLIDKDIKEKIKELDKSRRKYYLLANIRIYDNQNPKEIISQILKKINIFKE